MANLFPDDVSVITADPIEETVEIKFGRSYAFDFAKGDFKVSPSGKVIETEGFDAWVEWCMKAMQTARYRYLIYSRLHGQEFDDLIQRHLTRGGNESEIQRITTETLMRDPRTASVDNFTFNWKDDAVYFECDITSVLGENARVGNTVEVTENNG